MEEDEGVFEDLCSLKLGLEGTKPNHSAGVMGCTTVNDFSIAHNNTSNVNMESPALGTCVGEIGESGFCRGMKGRNDSFPGFEGHHYLLFIGPKTLK